MMRIFKRQRQCYFLITLNHMLGNKLSSLLSISLIFMPLLSFTCSLKHFDVNKNVHIHQHSSDVMSTLVQLCSKLVWSVLFFLMTFPAFIYSTDWRGPLSIIHSLFGCQSAYDD